MRYIKEYSDYLLNLDLSDLDRSRISGWMKQNPDAFTFDNDDVFGASLDDAIDAMMKDLGFPASKKDEITSFVQDNQRIQDDDGYPSLIMDPGYKLQYNDYVDGLSRYEIN